MEVITSQLPPPPPPSLLILFLFFLGRFGLNESKAILSVPRAHPGSLSIEKEEEQKKICGLSYFLSRLPSSTVCFVTQSKSFRKETPFFCGELPTYCVTKESGAKKAKTEELESEYCSVGVR